MYAVVSDLQGRGSVVLVAEEFGGACPINCGMDKIYAQRWGAEDFPCRHRRKVQELSFPTPLPPLTRSCPDEVIVITLPATDLWGAQWDEVPARMRRTGTNRAATRATRRR
jgi:hypothetical protein